MITKLSILTLTLSFGFTANATETKTEKSPTPTIEQSYNKGAKELYQQAQNALDDAATPSQHRKKDDLNSLRLDRVGRGQ